MTTVHKAIMTETRIQAAICIQTLHRGTTMRKAFVDLRVKVRLIQRNFKWYFTRKRFNALLREMKR